MYVIRIIINLKLYKICRVKTGDLYIMRILSNQFIINHRIKSKTKKKSDLKQDLMNYTDSLKSLTYFTISPLYIIHTTNVETCLIYQNNLFGNISPLLYYFHPTIAQIEYEG